LTDRQESVRAALLALRSLGDALDRMHGEVGDEMAMNLTDLRALRMMVEWERRGSAVSPHDLARHLRISTASTSKMVDRLAAAGHVERKPHPTDRRARVVVLTDHSRSTFYRHFGGHLGAMREIASDYDDEQLAVIAEFLDRMAQALDPRT
jgi:DNA-binding MarR family transcriptional regulator